MKTTKSQILDYLKSFVSTIHLLSFSSGNQQTDVYCTGPCPQASVRAVTKQDSM